MQKGKEGRRDSIIHARILPFPLPWLIEEQTKGALHRDAINGGLKIDDHVLAHWGSCRAASGLLDSESPDLKMSQNCSRETIHS